MSCKLPPAPFSRGLLTPHGHPGLSSPGFCALLPAFPFADAGLYPELGVPFPDWLPFGTPGCSPAWPGCLQGASTGGRLRLGRDEVPIEERRLRVLSKLGDGRGRAGTDGTHSRPPRPALVPVTWRKAGPPGFRLLSGPGRSRELRGFGALRPRVRE